MTFTPTQGDGAQLMDILQLQAALDGYSLVDPRDCEVTPGSTELTVDVASGEVRLGGGPVSIAAQTDVALPAPDSENPRKALVYLDSGGTIQTLGGDPATPIPSGAERTGASVPTVPVPSEAFVPLAEVWLPAGASDIVAADIASRRVPEVVSGQSFIPVRYSDPADPGQGEAWIRSTRMFDYLGSITESNNDVKGVVTFGDYLGYGDDDGIFYIHSVGDLDNAGNWSLKTTLTEESTSIDSGAAFDEYVAYGGSSGNLYVHNVSDWSLETTLTEAGGTISTIDTSGDYVGYGSYDENFYVHNINDWSLEATLTEAGQYVETSVVFSDGDYVAYGGRDDNFYIHNTNDWSLETTLSEGTGTIAAAGAFGGYVAYGGTDNNLYVHNVSDWSLETTLTESGDSLNDVIGFDDYVAYGGHGSEVFVHNVSDWSLETTLTQAVDDIHSIAVSDSFIAYGEERRYTTDGGNSLYIHGGIEGELAVHNGYQTDRFSPQ